MRYILCLALTYSLAGCGEQTAPEIDPAADASDVGGGGFDAGDTTSNGRCAAQAPLNMPFALHPGGPNTQINVTAARDDDQIWLAYNTRGVEDGFAIYLSRFDCSGALTLAPVQVNAGAERGAIEPQIAVGAESVLVVWQTDTPELENNLDIVARAFDLDGAPLQESARTLEMTRQGSPNPGNAWMPALRATDSGFVLAGAWGHQDAPAFQVFTQRLDHQGEPLGDATDVHLDPAAGQHYPALATGPAGDLVAWVHAPFESEESAWVARLAGNQNFAPKQLPFQMSGNVAADHVGTLALVAASSPNAQGDPELALVPIGDDGPHAPRALILGDPTRPDHTPAIAIQDTGNAALAFYRTISGYQNDLYVAHVNASATKLEAGEPVQLTTSGPAAPYTPALLSLGGGVWFVAWSEGTSPDFTLRAQFIAL